MRIFLTATAGLFFGAMAWAGSYLGVRDWGDPVLMSGARCAAMGGTGLARGKSASDFFLNPAALNFIDRGAMSLSGGVHFLTEKSVASSSQTMFEEDYFFGLDEFSCVWPVKKEFFWVGFGIKPVLEFYYQGALTGYEVDDSVSFQHSIDGKGCVWSGFLGVGYGVSSHLSVGLVYENRFGRETLNIERSDVGSDMFLSAREKAGYSAHVLKAGMHWRINDQVNVGAVCQPGYRMTREYDLSFLSDTRGVDTWNSPWFWGVGLSYLSKGNHDAELKAEITKIYWSQAGINGGSIGLKPIFKEFSSLRVFGSTGSVIRPYRDVMVIGLGIEHFLSDQWSLRYGMALCPFRGDPQVELTGFSVGAGRQLSPSWQWSFAYEFRKRDYVGDDVFYPSDRRRDEAFQRMLLSWEYFFENIRNEPNR